MPNANPLPNVNPMPNANPLPNSNPGPISNPNLNPTHLKIAAAEVLSNAPAPSPKDTAKLRVLHAIPNAPAVDVYADGQKLLTNVAYGKATDYFPVPGGSYQVDIYPTGMTGNALLSRKVKLTPAGTYTLAAAGTLEKPELIGYTDETSAPAGSARVRFIHLSPDAPGVDIAVKGGNTLFSNVGFTQATRYANVAPGTYDLDVKLAGTNTVALAVPNVSVAGGMTYTIVAIGLAGGNPALEALLLKG
jgi:hypothetical protein